MAFKKKNGTRCRVKISDPSHSQSPQQQGIEVETSPKVKASINPRMVNTLKVSGLEITFKTTPTSPTSSKAERNRRKKENAKERKAERSQKKADGAELLLKMNTMSLNERAGCGGGKGDSPPPVTCSSNGSLSSTSPTEENASEQQSIPSSNDQPGRLWEIKPSPGKGLGVFATQNIKKGTAIFQEMPLIQGGPYWLQKEAAFMLLPAGKQRDFMALCKRVGHDNARVYKIASRINHACFANTSQTFTTAGNIVISSIEDIKKSEKLTIDYIGVSNFAVSFRRAALQFQYGFRCFCKGCVHNKVLSTIEDWQSPDELPCSDILGQQLDGNELEALEHVELWYKALEFQITERSKLLRDIILKEYIEGIDRTEHILNTYEEIIAEWLERFKDFRLDENDIMKFQARIVHLVRQQMAAHIQDVKSGKSPMCFFSGFFDDKIKEHKHEQDTLCGDESSAKLEGRQSNATAGAPFSLHGGFSRVASSHK
ncbi:hypothetical protein N431DRAFT_476350 [Stipitochalara longipes BDJ]|nr:hypothetical protein N431DRAFT_476350 [Stipitochalara longipes BDJ]